MMAFTLLNCKAEGVWHLGEFWYVRAVTCNRNVLNTQNTKRRIKNDVNYLHAPVFGIRAHVYVRACVCVYACVCLKQGDLVRTVL